MKSNANNNATENSADLESRHCAAVLLCGVIDEHTPLDVCMSKSELYRQLSDQNRAFCLRLMQQYLKHYGQCEKATESLLHKPLHKQLSYVQVHIGLAMTQIACMEIPAYAAVNSAVELTKRVSEPHAGVVNAILNKWIKEFGAHFQADALSNIPAWFRTRWQKRYGDDVVTNIANAILFEAPIDISFKNAATLDAWLQNNADKMPELVGKSVRLVQPGRISELAGYAEGDWWVQDVAATLPVILLGDVAGKNVLDMCAAPGGKTMQLAALGARVTALDSSKKRLETLKENLERTKFDKVTLICSDALKYTPEKSVDVILLDAPCSATGTLRRNPDVILHRNANNLFEQATKQRKLLNHAADMLPKGGIIGYAVCSLEPEEGEKQIEYLLKERQDIIVDMEKIMLPLELQASEFGLRSHPAMLADLGGMDGFFMTRLRKI